MTYSISVASVASRDFLAHPIVYSNTNNHRHFWTAANAAAYRE